MKRYNIEVMPDDEIIEDKNGTWCLYNDVEKLIMKIYNCKIEDVPGYLKRLK